jgi:teichoic acid transport system ATP-binding protein
MSSDIVLRVNNVGKRYELYEAPHHRLLQTLFRGRKQFYKEFWALRDVSFEIKRGECIGIIGRNGSGKSTLLQIVAGTLTPTTGTVEIQGKVSALLELGSGFNPEFTGRENAYLNGAIQGFSKSEMDKKIKDIATFADIGEFFDQPVKTYSSGMYVRLAFAVATSTDPDILIIDEALSVGDMSFQKKCMEKIDEFREAGKTILFCSHDIHAVSALCSKVLLLIDGSVKTHGEPDNVIAEYVYLMGGGKFDTEKLKNPNISFENSTEVEILKFLITDSTGIEKHIFKTGEDIFFEVEYNAINGIHNPTYSLLILRGNKNPIAINKSMYYKDLQPEGFIKGVHKIRFIIKNNSFAPGKYFPGISVWDSASKIRFALNRTIEFEIMSNKVIYGDMEQQVIFYPEVNWVFGENSLC